MDAGGDVHRDEHGRAGAVAAVGGEPAGGTPRVERLVPRLEPGGAILRTFRIPDAAAALAAGDVQVTLRETDGPAVLNQRVGGDGHRVRRIAKKAVCPLQRARHAD